MAVLTLSQSEIGRVAVLLRRGESSHLRGSRTVRTYDVHRCPEYVYEILVRYC